MGQVKLKLQKPVTEGSETISELIFRDVICAGDVRDIPVREPTYGDMLKLAGRLTSKSAAVIDRLEWFDTLEVVKIVGGFMGAGSATGSTPSP